jgi:hypothetical protein
MCRILATVALLSALGNLAKADDQADARVILDAGIKAQGGDAALSKVTGANIKSKGTWYEQHDKTPVVFESFFDGSDKSRVVSLNSDNTVAEIEVVNGQSGWEKQADQSSEALEGDQLATRREWVYVNWVTMLTPLRGGDFRLSTDGETEVAGRKAVGIIVEREKHDPVKLYFDKETHLLVKYEHKSRNDDGKVIHEDCVLLDYRNVQDTKQPFKIELHWDGVKVCDLAVTDIKLFYKPLDRKLFEKP